MNKINVIGLDLAKNVFQVHGVDSAGEVVVRKQLKRSQVRLRQVPQRDRRPFRSRKPPFTGWLYSD